MNYRDLVKLYPEFKIPVEKFSEYYIDTLIRTKEASSRPLELWRDCIAKHGDINTYKMKKMDEILNYFKEQKWDLNDIIWNSEDYGNRDFNNYKQGKYYISLDLKEANWQAFKDTFNLRLPVWKEFVEEKFGLHPFISESKTFRQFVFGNTNPKRLQKAQEKMLSFLLCLLPDHIKASMVGKRSDELIFEVDVIYSELITEIEEAIKKSFLDIRITTFRIQNMLSAGENIKLKYIFSCSPHKVKMMNVPGHRYFIHLKNLIKEDIVDEDLYFENDRKLAKWVI